MPAVLLVLQEWGLIDAKLPKNMTGKLQVMDLVTNGPLKAGMRRERVVSIFNYFQNWKVARLQAVVNKTELVPFSPPKPTLLQGLSMITAVGHDVFARPAYKQGMMRCFIKVGQAPQPDDRSYVKQVHDA